MTLKLLPVTSAEEIKQLTALQLNAFLRVPFAAVIWPHGITPAIQASGEARYTKLLETDPSARLLKVVDTANGQSIAFAVWHLFLTPEDEGQRKDLGRREWGVDVNVDVAYDFWGGIVTARKMMAGKAHYFLAILATDTAHHRRGAGGMLVKWGTDQADERGLPCFVESSPDGLGLYKKCGFREVGGYVTDLGNQEWVRDGTNMYRHVIMYRPSKGEGEDETDALTKALERAYQRP